MNFDTLINTQQLQSLQDKNKDKNIDVDILIIDVRHNLANPEAGYQSYLQNHIDGAYFLHMDKDLSAQMSGLNGRHPLPDIAQLSAKLKAMGLNKSTQVIVYDAENGMMAARLWWLLKYMGHTKVAVLEGGLKFWKMQGLALTPKLPTLNADLNKSDFKAQIQTNMLIKLEWLLENIDDPNIQIIDARPNNRFKGEDETMDPIGGHIPHAINRPFTENMSTENINNTCFKSAKILRQELEIFLEDHMDKMLIHSCGSGVSACHNILAFEIAGFKNTKLYAGSWSEYCCVIKS